MDLIQIKSGASKALLKNTRGRGGGIRLARAAAEINVARVVRATEGAARPAECAGTPARRAGHGADDQGSAETQPNFKIKRTRSGFRSRRRLAARRCTKSRARAAVHRAAPARAAG
ncbi:MAG: Rrf2 family transcriptional regulator [Burkholderiales bacterium]